MKVSKTLQYFAALFLTLMAIGFVMHKTGYTFQVVDQIYCRGHLPWADETKLERCIYRSGDDLFENDLIETELLYLQDNPYQQSYSERIMNGYPIADAYAANRYSLFHLFSQFLPTTSSIVFSSLIILFVSFTLGYALGRALSFDKKYSLVFGILSLTPTYAALFESWNISLIAYDFLLLGLIHYYRYGRFKLCALFSFIGASLILLSSIYQLYVYAAINFAFLAVMYFTSKEKKKYVFLLLTVAGAFLFALLIWNQPLRNHLSFLLTSNKLGHEVPLSELIARKGLALDPLGWVGTELVLVHRRALNKVLPENIFVNLQPFMSGLDSPGIAYLLLLFVGLAALWKKEGIYRLYVGVVLFWWLYFTGPLQLLLSATIGDPFKSETSVRGSYFFFLFGLFAVIWVLRGLGDGSLELSKKVRVMLTIASSYVLFLSLVLLAVVVVRGSTFSEAPYHAVSAASVLLALWYLYKKKRRAVEICLMISLIFPIAARLFLGATPAVFAVNKSELYFPRTEFQEILNEHTDIKRLMLVQTSGGNPLHPNVALNLGRSSVNAYRNPTDKAYLELSAYYQLLLRRDDADRGLDQFRQSADYTRNGLPPFVLTGNVFQMTTATTRFFDLFAIDGIIGSNDLVIDAGWSRLGAANNLSLWQREGSSRQFFFNTKKTFISDDRARLASVFSHPDEAILSESVGFADKEFGDEKSAIQLLESLDGYRKFRVELSESGILSIPATYSQHWRAAWIDETGKHALRTVETNYAFLGVVLPVGSGEVELRYDEQRYSWQYALTGLGVVMLSLLIFWSLRFSGGRAASRNKWRIIYALAIVLVTIVSAELLLRFLPSQFQHPYRISYDNKLGIGQQLIPNLKENNWNLCFGAVTYSTNEWGMRDRPRTLEKTLPRIAVLSDSFMEAEQVNDETVLNHQLERLYDDKLEVLNFAMGGIGTTHEAILYDTWVRQFKPDVVMLMFSLSNDISNNSYALEKIAYKDHPFLIYREPNGELVNREVISPKKQLRQWLLRYSALARLMKQVNSSLRYRPVVPNPISTAASTASEEAAQRYHTLRQEQYLLPPDPIWEDAWRVTEQELMRLRDKARGDGAELIVVIMPDKYELEDDTNFLVEGDMPTRALDKEIDLTYPRTRLINYLEEQQIPIYDLASDMKEYALAHALPKPFYSFPCDLHWTPLGHRVATDFIFDYLQHSSSTLAGLGR